MVRLTAILPYCYSTAVIVYAQKPFLGHYLVDKHSTRIWTLIWLILKILQHRTRRHTALKLPKPKLHKTLPINPLNTNEERHRKRKKNRTKCCEMYYT